VATASAAMASEPMIAALAKSAAKQAHEFNDMQLAGMTEKEIEEAGAIMSRTNSKFKAISVNEILHTIRTMRSVFGGFEEAAELLEEVMKFRLTYKLKNPHASPEEVEQKVDSVIKASEIMGAAKNPAAFKTYLEGIAKAINTFGSTINPEEFKDYAQYSRQGAMGYEPEFVAGIMPTLIQHHGGAQAGTAGGAFYSAIVGGKMSNLAVHELDELGLLRKDKNPDGTYKYLSQTTTGDIKGVLAGGVQNAELARLNPFKWINQVLGPALEAHGITDPGKQDERIARMFSSRIAAQFVAEQLTQRRMFEKDAGLSKKSRGLDAALEFAEKDLTLSAEGLKNQFEALSALVGKDLVPAITSFVNQMSRGLDTARKGLEDDPKSRIRAELGTGLLALLGGHAALSTLGGYFGGPGLLASSGAALNFLGPLAAVGTAGMLGYKTYQGLQETSAQADKVDAIFGRGPIAEAARSRLFAEASGVRSGRGPGGFGFGPYGNATAAPPAELRGSADIGVRVTVAPDPRFITQVTQQVLTSGNLSQHDELLGVTMPPGRR